MNIKPVNPNITRPAGEDDTGGRCSETESRRTFGISHPSRRTFGISHPSRRTFGISHP